MKGKKTNKQTSKQSENKFSFSCLMTFVNHIKMKTNLNTYVFCISHSALNDFCQPKNYYKISKRHVYPERNEKQNCVILNAKSVVNIQKYPAIRRNDNTNIIADEWANAYSERYIISIIVHL